MRVAEGVPLVGPSRLIFGGLDFWSTNFRGVSASAATATPPVSPCDWRRRPVGGPAAVQRPIIRAWTCQTTEPTQAWGGLTKSRLEVQKRITAVVA